MLNALLDYFFPRYCLVCGNDTFTEKDRFICPECKIQAQRKQTPMCKSCSAPLNKKNKSNQCPTCKKRKNYLTHCLSPCLYVQQAKQIISRCKFSSRTALVPEMAQIMANYATGRFLTPPTHVVPVPQHPLKNIFSSKNHTQLLARQIASILNIEYAPTMLKKTRLHKPQKKLPYAKRLTNVKNTFSTNQATPIPPSHILLVDDVIATGTTVNECAKVLIEAGADKASALVFAVTPPPSTPKTTP